MGPPQARQAIVPLASTDSASTRTSLYRAPQCGQSKRDADSFAVTLPDSSLSHGVTFAGMAGALYGRWLTVPPSLKFQSADWQIVPEK